MMLLALATECDGLSGRALRKLPFLAHALFVPPHAAAGAVTAGATAGGHAGQAGGAGLALDDYLVALKLAVEHERQARSTVEGGD